MICSAIIGVMGKAGQALKQVLDEYKIGQSTLAKNLGVERSIIFRWYHEQTDPTAETVFEIVKALRTIDRYAANNFIEAYLGDSSQTPGLTTNKDLPLSDRVNVSALSQIFDRKTNSYKYLFFFSLLDILRRRNFDTLSPITFQEIIIEMLAIAWYPHNYFKLSFGVQDQIAKKLDSLNLIISEPILKFKDPDKKLLRATIQTQNLDDVIKTFKKYVPFRLIRPFFEQETKAIKDNSVNSSVCKLASDQFKTVKPLYCFDSESDKDCTAITLHQDWIEYIAENYSIVRGWASWEWLNYMQSKNTNIPNIVSKLFIPQNRDSLNKQSKYWKLILDHQNLKCIYSQSELNKDSISLDHYLPWSFVAHDQLWNLIPTTQSVNSSKSNNIPAEQYFTDFVKLQHQGLTIFSQNTSRGTWLKRTPDYIAELKVNQADDLLDFEILHNAYVTTVQPLVSLAAIQGFKQNWTYQHN